MEFRILGPLDVVDDIRQLTLGGPKQRAVLAHLILRVNAVVAIDLLIDALWVRTPRNSEEYAPDLHLAAAEAPGRASDRGTRRRVRSRLCSGGNRCGTLRSARETRQGRHRVGPSCRSGVLVGRPRDLAGNALVDLAEEASLRGEITRLEEMRLSATEHLMSAELAAGRHSTVVGRLEVLTDRYPMRERLWASLMLALYRSGRQGDALAPYQAARRVLADEFGIDPSPELQRLNQLILGQDPELVAPDARAPASTFQVSKDDLEPG
jgi:DNA-binding SARP family transcriptional activator